jgi:hypothetical protein
MKKIFTLAVAAMTAMCAFAQDYTQSVGLVVGSLNGASYKYFISEELAIQADLGIGVMATGGSLVDNLEKNVFGEVTKSKTVQKLNASLWTLQVAPNFIWQKDLTTFDWGKLDFFVGGGLTLGYAKFTKGEATEYKHYEEGKEVESGKYKIKPQLSAEACEDNFGKFGINAIAGVELALTSAPITIGLDFRPGYGLMFSGKEKDSKETYMGTVSASATRNYSFFDWTLAATVRYTF